MIKTQNNLIKAIFSIGVMAFLFLGVFGLSHFNMQMDQGVSMPDCPFMIGDSICTMTPFEHLSLWQNMFSNIPTQEGITFTLLFSISIVFVFFLIQKNSDAPPQRQRAIFAYLKSTEYIPLTHSFQELFSDGILNPKSF